MASPFAQLSAFARTRNGKIVLGGGSVGGVAGLALYRRHKAAAGGAATATAGSAAATPSYLQTTGTSGANAGAAPTDNSSSSGAGGVDPGQFQDLITTLGNQTDALNQVLANQSAPPQGPAAPPPSVTITAPVPTWNPAPAPAPPPVVAPPAAPPPAPAPRTYTVKSGDNLSVISQRYYGTQSKWPTIYNANKGVIGGNPNLIKPGQVLVIP